MEYTSCVIVKSTSQSHKHDNPLQNTIFLAFCNGIYDLLGIESTEHLHSVGIESDSTATQTPYSIAKHPFLRYSVAKYHFFSVLQWNILGIESKTPIKSHTNTIFLLKIF